MKTNKTIVCLGSLALPVVSVFFLGTLCALAKGPQELEVYERVVGNWTCAGHTMPSGDNPGHPFSATIKIGRELEGSVYVDRYDEVKSAEHQQPFSSISLWTYDPESRRYVQNGVDSFGNRFERTSTGWHGSEWVWEVVGVREGMERLVRGKRCREYREGENEAER